MAPFSQRHWRAFTLGYAFQRKLRRLLLPRSAARRPDPPLRLVSMRHDAVQVYELVEHGANHGFCFALDKRHGILARGFPMRNFFTAASPARSSLTWS